MPGPKPDRVNLSSRQRCILERNIRREKCHQRDLRRAKIILEASKGLNNHQIADQLGINRDTVRLWRDRWVVAEEHLSLVEQEEDDDDLESLIRIILADEVRPGGPTIFTPEQICQIIALACEKPEDSDRPVTHWTPKELAAEAIKRDIVESISARTIGRFLKGGRPQAPPKPVLVEQRTRKGSQGF